MITIVDYGLGNVGAFVTMYKRMSIQAVPARTAEELRVAERIVLPGVGAFDHAMQLLSETGMRDTLDELVLERKVPVLGVCVGMQMIAEASEEGQERGLGWIGGTVRSLYGSEGLNGLPLPHMGWNDVTPRRHLSLFEGLDDPRYYFLHSFYFDNSDPADAAATVEYGREFTCMVNRDHIWGVQFHPEKSHHFGAALLKNFATSAC